MASLYGFARQGIESSHLLAQTTRCINGIDDRNKHSTSRLTDRSKAADRLKAGCGHSLAHRTERFPAPRGVSTASQVPASWPTHGRDPRNADPVGRRFAGLLHGSGLLPTGRGRPQLRLGPNLRAARRKRTAIPLSSGGSPMTTGSGSDMLGNETRLQTGKVQGDVPRTPEIDDIRSVKSLAVAMQPSLTLEVQESAPTSEDNTT
jgi:hypothetical protein